MTLDLAPHDLRPGDRLPEFGDAIIHRVADRRTTSDSGVVEVWFTTGTTTPLGFRPGYGTVQVERAGR